MNGDPDAWYWSGDEWRWRLTSGGLPHHTISVIEKPSESYEGYHQRKVKEEGAEREPFGFARALPKSKRKKVKPKAHKRKKK
jgi:hypothetical protein